MIHTMRLHLLWLIVITAAASAFAQPAQDQTPVTPIPVLTDEDRAAAFPDAAGHGDHDGKWNYFALFDRLEWRNGSGERSGSWDATGWVGGDLDRLWIRTEGEADRQHVYDAEATLLYGHSFSRWWDFVGGVRQDLRPGPAQTWAAAGIQGLAPNFFEIQATAYVGAAGRMQARVEGEYELLITNRLILQPRAEIDVAVKSDSRRSTGSGLTTAEAGLRLRYEFRREFAPYVGVHWERMFGETADFVKAQGDSVRTTRFTAGLRFWF